VPPSDGGSNRVSSIRSGAAAKLPVTRFGNGICSQSARGVKYVKQNRVNLSDRAVINSRQTPFIRRTAMTQGLSSADKKSNIQNTYTPSTAHPRAAQTHKTLYNMRFLISPEDAP